MKKYMMLLILSGLLLILFSCQDDLDETETGASTDFVIIDKDTKQTVSVYEYSEDGQQLLSFESYDENEKLEKAVIYEYDTAGTLSRSITSTPASSSSADFTNVKSYTNDGKLSSILTKNTSGSDLQTDYTYDDEGNIISITQSSTDGIVTTVEGKSYE